ncbi:sulfatase [Flammeovirga agarivorans]|uniref:Sulfatase n=1 Tax=Flammeovirga agarivorans TaxID=2726742 RepID=A0A7X8XXW2_9BACT|nr:sulfatase [Flammeovirga agarivorans]NLR93513.1 sulfatase [Flammeovirga agarivorans]
MKRLILLIALFSTALAYGDKKPKNKKKPNVLFITVDDLNTHIPLFGYKDVMTPNIDKLAGDGVLFRQAFCQYPVCGPSRASFLTGMYPDQTKIFTNGPHVIDTRPDAVSIGKVFKDNDYWVANTGKVYHPRSEDFKWDATRKLKMKDNDLVLHLKGKFEAQYGPIDTPEKQKAWEVLRAQYKNDDRQGEHALPLPIKDGVPLEDDLNVTTFNEWIDNAAYGDKPFFIAYGFHKPHVQYTAPQRFFDMYPLEDIKPEKVPFDDWNEKPLIANWKRYEAFEDIYFGLSQMDARKRYMQGYYACITYIDDLLGQLISKLKEKNLYEDTIIVFFSDHGYHMGNHFLYGKVSLYEESAKSPLIIRVPGNKNNGEEVSKTVELLDVFPTVTDLVGLSTPETVQGKSLAPLLKNTKDKNFEKVALTYARRGELTGKSVRTDRYRYTQWGEDEKVSELYDYKKDPKEYKNLIYDPLYSEVLKEMRSIYQKKIKEAALIEVEGK